MDLEIQRLKKILEDIESGSLDFYRIPHHVIMRSLILTILKLYEDQKNGIQQ